MLSVMNKFLYPTAATVAAATAAAALASSSSAPSEAPSEISSVESDWSDIKNIAVKLGVTNPEELHTDRFKVNRQKMEQMIKAESPIANMNGAEYFFENIMKTTETYISWPCRLKLGSKSRRDPHVRIVGKAEDVARAKEYVLDSLDYKGTRVILKIDVSYTDHSYIIGRGGNNIKRIMEETSTHIHFPDSNRSNPTEKSNQVSLCGTLEGVEKARALVRLSTPLLISFELPIMPVGTQPDHDTPYVTLVEKKYNVQVIFSSRPKLHSVLVLIKGSVSNASQVQEATEELINLSCGSVANQILVHMQLEISPQHHEIVKGVNNRNLLSIMERTKTKIIFPDLTDLNIKPLKKSQIVITGTIDGVYKARQQLLGNLPVALIFDFPDIETEAATIMSLRSKYGVYIGLRQKQRQSTLAVVVKGLEKFIEKIYETRHEILHLTTELVKPAIPETYFMPQDKNLSNIDLALLTSLLEDHNEANSANNNLARTKTHLNNQQNHRNNNNITTNNNNNTTTTATATTTTNNNNNNNNKNPNSNDNSKNHIHNHNSNSNEGKICNSDTNNNHSNKNNNADNNQTSKVFNADIQIKHHQQQQQQQQQQQYSLYSNALPPQYMPMLNNSFNRSQQQLASTNSNNNFLPMLPPQPSTHSYHLQQQQQHQQQQLIPSVNLPQTQMQMHSAHSISPRNSCSSNTSGYQSFSSSTNSLEQAFPPFANPALNGAVNLFGASRPPPISPDSTCSGGDLMCSRLGRRSSDGVLLGVGMGNSMGPNAADSYRSLRYDTKSRIFDFDLKRTMAYKAMERPPIPGELRTPNANWMGLGLSCTSPAGLDNGNDSWSRFNASGNAGACCLGPINGLRSPYNLGTTTGLLDSTPTNRRIHLPQIKDIQTLLVSLGLEHYIKVFVLNEIDLEMLASLTEENLMELGITAFGARKKLMVAIHSLKARDTNNGGLFGPSCCGNSSPRFSGSAAPGAERRPSNQW